MEVGFLGTWELEQPTPNPGSKNTPKACPTHNSSSHEPHPPHPAPAQAPFTLNRVQRRNEDNNNCTTNNNEVRRRGEKTLKLSNIEHDALNTTLQNYKHM